MNQELTIDLQKAARIQNKDLVLILLKELNVDLTPKYVDKSGLKWYAALPGHYNYDSAIFIAECLGLRVPTKEEFELAELEGFRSKLDGLKDRWFWSSSPHPNYADYAWVFGGFYGRGDVGFRSVDYSVRLVSK